MFKLTIRRDAKLVNKMIPLALVLLQRNLKYLL